MVCSLSSELTNAGTLLVVSALLAAAAAAVLRKRWQSWFDRTVEDAFNACDRDSSGGIDASELYLGVLWLYSHMAAYGVRGRPPSRQQAFAILKVNDHDHDNCLNLAEFKSVLSQLSVKLLQRALLQGSFVLLCPALGGGAWALLRRAAPLTAAAVGADGCLPSLPPTLLSCGLMLLLPSLLARVDALAIKTHVRDRHRVLSITHGCRRMSSVTAAVKAIQVSVKDMSGLVPGGRCSSGGGGGGAAADAASEQAPCCGGGGSGSGGSVGGGGGSYLDGDDSMSSAFGSDERSFHGGSDRRNDDAAAAAAESAAAAAAAGSGISSHDMSSKSIAHRLRLSQQQQTANAPSSSYPPTRCEASPGRASADGGGAAAAFASPGSRDGCGDGACCSAYGGGGCALPNTEAYGQLAACVRSRIGGGVSTKAQQQQHRSSPGVTAVATTGSDGSGSGCGGICTANGCAGGGGFGGGGSHHHHQPPAAARAHAQLLGKADAYEQIASVARARMTPLSSAARRFADAAPPAHAD